MTNRWRSVETKISVLAALALAEAAGAQDARWKADPPGNDWNDPADWDPATVPTGTATFGPSSRTEIIFSQQNMAVGTMRFEADAPAYTFVLDGRQRLRVTGFGVDNLSANPVNFLIGTRPTDDSPSGDQVRFEGSSTAGNSLFTNGIPSGFRGGLLTFRDTSSAATATITNYFLIDFEGSSSGGRSRITNSAGIRLRETATADQATIDNIHGGYIMFEHTSTAARASIRNANALTYFQGLSTAGSSHIVNETGPIRTGGRVNIVLPTSLGDVVSESEQETGLTVFRGGARAGTATIVNNAGARAFVPGSRMTLSNSGGTIFDEDSSAENAAITNNGGTSGAFLRITGPRSDQRIETNNAAVTFFATRATAAEATIVNNNAAWTVFFDQSSAGAATITTNSGSTVLFRDQSSGGTARFINNAGGTFDISGLTAPGTQAGSIEGGGAIMLGGRRLTLGGSNRSTEISGVISDGGFSGGAGGSLAKAGTGTLILTGASTYTGGTTIEAGTLQLGNGCASGSILGNVANEGILAFNRSDAVSYGGTVSGTGALRQEGTGTLILTGTNIFTGGTTVVRGTLLVNGSTVGSTSVDAGARLGGTGRIGSGSFAGTVAPGTTGIGTLGTTGNITFAAGSAFQVEVDATGASDRLAVGGIATLQGGTVSAVFLGNADNRCGAPIQSTILTAASGVAGRFSGVNSNFAFLTPSLSYDANNVFLTLTRNAATFSERGATENQRASAAAAEALQCGNALFDPLVQLSTTDVHAAFDQLSGEIHPGTRGALMDDSRFVREALSSVRSDGRAVWASGYGSWGRIEGDMNAAAVDRDSSGIFAGFDLPLGRALAAGVAGGRSRASFGVGARNSEADVASWHAAAYASMRFAGFRLLAGGAMSWHDVETGRTVAFTGFSDAPTARYDGRTRQIFAEASYALPLGAARIEPFASIALVDVETESFTEAGGAAALTGEAESDSARFTILGLRAEIGIGPLSLTGSAGWRHASGLDPSRTTFTFGSGGTPFAVSGASIAEDALMTEAGAEVSLGGTARLRLVYSGQMAAGTEDHGARATLSVPF